MWNNSTNTKHFETKLSALESYGWDEQNDIKIFSRRFDIFSKVCIFVPQFRAYRLHIFAKIYISSCSSHSWDCNACSIFSIGAVLIEKCYFQYFTMFYYVGLMYHILMLNILYHFVRLFHTILTHLILYQTVLYLLSYFPFTLPAEHWHQKFPFLGIKKWTHACARG